MFLYFLNTKHDFDACFEQRMSVCVHARTYVCVYIYVCMYICMYYVCMYACMHVCNVMHVCVYTHTHVM